MEARTQRPTPKRHFAFPARSNIYGVFDDLEAVRELTTRLVALGYGGETIEILEGDDAVRRIDRDGREHGLIARFMRYLQAMTDERAHVESYVQELLQGHYVVSVRLTSREMYQPTCEAFRAAGGHLINYYGPFVVEPISA